ncbi:MAG TPA: BON domain-containing protein [Chthoniobacteraceae bacterium]|jgi:osmotically-inducible protein OsmY|nr:BON domain-containing protein [Chthoniobacteraceae bacterium]
MKIKITLLATLWAVPMVLCAADQNADNTARNGRDITGDSLTPIDQSTDAGDVKITADTRKLIMGDSSLSMNAKNCKIITAKGGVVTLRGPVNSTDEKAAIVKYAKAAGAKTVHNQLEVEVTR